MNRFFSSCTTIQFCFQVILVLFNFLPINGLRNEDVKMNLFLIDNIDRVYNDTRVRQDIRSILVGGSKILDLYYYNDNKEAQRKRENMIKVLKSMEVEASNNVDLLSNYKRYIDLQKEGFIMPGLIDMHVHVSGGGGENSFQSRTPEAKLTELIDAGITSFVGILGTDDIARTPHTLLAKVKSFKEQGLNGYMWTGSYDVLDTFSSTSKNPYNLLTNSIKQDIMEIEEVLGIGEVAVSDHRSSQESIQQLKELAAEARVAGLLSGKPGLFYAHMGSYRTGIEPLEIIVNTTSIPVTNILPTHMTRSELLVEQAVDWMTVYGGKIDITSGTKISPKVISDYFHKNKSFVHEQISISSDAYGSSPHFNAAGELVRYEVQSPLANWNLFNTLVNDYDLLIQDILPMFTSTPARILNLPHNLGTVTIGGNADFLIVKQVRQGGKTTRKYVEDATNRNNTMVIDSVYCKGIMLKNSTWTKPDFIL